MLGNNTEAKIQPKSMTIQKPELTHHSQLYYTATGSNFPHTYPAGAILVAFLTGIMLKQ